MLKRIWFTFSPFVAPSLVFLVLFAILFVPVSAFMAWISPPIPPVDHAYYFFYAAQTSIICLGLCAWWDLSLRDRWRQSAALSEREGE